MNNKLKYILILLVFVSFLFVVVEELRAQGIVTGTFTTTNTAPTITTDMKIQDFDDGAGCLIEADCYDDYDGDLLADTHMSNLINSTNPSPPYLRWTEGIDDEGDTVYTMICFSSSEAKRDAAAVGDDGTNCDVLNLFTQASRIDASQLLLAYDFFNHSIENSTAETQKEYYLRFVSTDESGSEVSPAEYYDAEITFVNFVPVTTPILDIETLDIIGSPYEGIANTHYQNPSIVWGKSGDFILLR